MQSVEYAVIAAAGLGSRLGHGMPKCMLEIGGVTLLSKLIHILEPIVPHIHVVVGYREEMIIELVARHHRKVVLVRNPQFRTTNTAQSMALGAKGCSGKVVFIDGDLLIEPGSLRNFITRAATCDLMVGVTSSISENAVFVQSKSVAFEDMVVTGFSRTEASALEWANVFSGPAGFLDDEKNYVFNRLEHHLPAPAFSLNLREVDTIADLAEARRFDQVLASMQSNRPSEGVDEINW